MYGLLFWIFSRHFLSLNLTPINQGACLAGGCLRFNLSPLTDTEINLLAKLYTLWGVLIFFPPNYMYTPNSASIQSSRFVPFVFEIGSKTRLCYCISAKKENFSKWNMKLQVGKNTWRPNKKKKSHAMCLRHFSWPFFQHWEEIFWECWEFFSLRLWTKKKEHEREIYYQARRKNTWVLVKISRFLNLLIK